MKVERYTCALTTYISGKKVNSAEILSFITVYLPQICAPDGVCSRACFMSNWRVIGMGIFLGPLHAACQLERQGILNPGHQRRRLVFWHLSQDTPDQLDDSIPVKDLQVLAEQIVSGINCEWLLHGVMNKP